MASNNSKKKKKPQEEKGKINPALERYYSLGLEKDRLTNSRLEKDRMLNLLQRKMPSAPAEVLDVGGAHGVYAFPLAERGYKVHLIDPIPVHIQQAQEYEQKFPSFKLASYSVGDARNIIREDESAEVVLFFGPLYHLVSHMDRLKALKEAYRVLKKGGILFVTVISRCQSLMENICKNLILEKANLIKQDLSIGIHPSENSKMDLYFHSPKELKRELQESGFHNITLIGVEGPVWYQPLLQEIGFNREAWIQLLNLLEMIEDDESIIGASTHVMGIAKK